MKQTIRSFALGLLVAGVIILATFYFTDDTRQASQKLSTDEMIASIENEGYHVLSESEYISVSVNSGNGKNDESTEENKKSEEDKSTENNKDKNQQNNDKKDKNDDDKKDNDSGDSKKKKSDKEKTITYTLKIKSGMAPSIISNKLAKNDIIDNADKFTEYMEDHNYTTKVQLGKFKFTSDMSHHEIAEELTN